MTTRSHWGDALIEFSDEEPRGGGGRFCRVDDTEELLGDAFIGAHVTIYWGARVYIYLGAHVYIWARHEI